MMGPGGGVPPPPGDETSIDATGLGGDVPARGESPADEEPPPILGTWKRLYALVLLNLAALILFFYFFTKRFE